MRTPFLRTFQCLYRASVPRTPAARTFTTTPTAFSGHSRWSKIKHDKGKVDSRRGASFSKFSQEISYASRDGGLDNNLRLNAAVSAAKKAGMSKDRIQAAVQRGQGKSTSGAALEPVTIEAIMPGNVAVIVDCQTENKLRTLQDVKLIFNGYGARFTPTNYLFSKKGLVRVLAGSGGHSFDDVMEAALEEDGTEDVEEVAEGDNEEGKPEIIITTEPTKTQVVTTGVKGRLPGLVVVSYAIEWVPNEDTMVDISGDKAGSSLDEMVEKLEDYSDVSAVYTNAKEA